MQDNLQILLDRIRDLENELVEEIEKKEKDFSYEIRRRKVCFEREARRQHRSLVKKIRHYLLEAAWLNILTTPVIWSCLVPAVLMDLVLTVYQSICFPIYRIPKVARRDYIIIDRHYLAYLNAIEKLNCVYCGYFNGVIQYAQEVAGRTEQYWCPIKHAVKLKSLHNRYRTFFDYGDAEGYRKRIEEVRQAFDDLKEQKPV